MNYIPVTIRFENLLLEALPPPVTPDRLHQYLNHSTSMKAGGWALKLLSARILAPGE